MQGPVLTVPLFAPRLHPRFPLLSFAPQLECLTRLSYSPHDIHTTPTRYTTPFPPCTPHTYPRDWHMSPDSDDLSPVAAVIPETLSSTSDSPSSRLLAYTIFSHSTVFCDSPNCLSVIYPRCQTAGIPHALLLVHDLALDSTCRRAALLGERMKMLLQRQHGLKAPRWSFRQRTRWLHRVYRYSNGLTRLLPLLPLQSPSRL